MVSVRRAWELVLSLPAENASTGTVVAAAGPGQGEEGALAVGLCRPVAETLDPPATRLLVLIDRSRSVGPGNAAVARDLARALALALPPSLTFNVVLFDREAEPLFRLPRSATLEALGVLEGSVGLGSLRNGTDLALALRRAGQLAAADPAPGPAYWVVITDGALPDHDSPATIGEALARVPAGETQAAMVIIRTDGDDPVAPGARRALVEMPARLGGILRELPASGAVGAAAAIVEGLRGSGDLLDVRVAGSGLSPALLQPVSIRAGERGPGDRQDRGDGRQRAGARAPRRGAGLRRRGPGRAAAHLGASAGAARGGRPGRRSGPAGRGADRAAAAPPRRAGGRARWHGAGRGAEGAGVCILAPGARLLPDPRDHAARRTSS